MIESTGVFNTDEKASMHIQAGAKKVILTAPGKGDRVGTFVVGVNDDLPPRRLGHPQQRQLHHHCLAPIVRFWIRTSALTGV